MISMGPNDLMMIFMAMMFAMTALEVYDLFMGSKPQHMIDRPVDVHGRIYKNLKKSASSNLGGTSLRYLDCVGEADSYDFTYGRISGIHSGMYTEIVLAKTGRFKPARLIYIPREIVRDKHGTHFCVDCNGFMPHGNFYVPIWTSTTSKEDADRMLQLCLDQDAYMIKMEEIIELSEQEAHAMVDALSVKHRNKAIIERKDHLDKVPGEEGGERFNDDD